MRSRQRISEYGRGVYKDQNGSFYAKLVRRGARAGHPKVVLTSKRCGTPDEARAIRRQWLQAEEKSFQLVKSPELLRTLISPM